MAASTGAGRVARPAPRDQAELLDSARALAGLDVDALARRMGVAVGRGRHAKGKVGELVERALGATGGSRAEHDFPDLGVELKTVPLGPNGVPRESTFVCAVLLVDADRAEWDASWTRRKLSRVLWLPVLEARSGERTLGQALLWSPTREQEAILREDFDEIIGRIGAGGVQMLSARVGRWLQLRPKAASGRVRTSAPGAFGEDVQTVPRGFYLRPRFTDGILRNPRGLPP
jgi:DNA mismatch repair protein MutH